MVEEAERGKAGLEKVIVEVGEKVELGKTVRGGKGFKGVRDGHHLRAVW